MTFVSLLCFSISLPIIYSRTVGGDKRLDGWRVRDNIGREVGKEKEKERVCIEEERGRFERGKRFKVDSKNKKKKKT